MAYRIDLFDSSGARVAIIQEEIISSLSLDTAIDSAPTLTLSIPLSEEKTAYISPAYHLKIWNTTTAAYEHSVFTLCDPDIEDSGGALKITATYQGILTRLSNEDIDAYDTGSAGDTFENVITALLAFQLNTPAITLGTIEPVQTVALAVENTTIYSALNAVRDAFGGWFEVDADYQLNWYNDNTNTPDREIRRSKNLKSLTYTPSYTQIVNRVYAYGKGESDARINLGDIVSFKFTGGGSFTGSTSISVGDIIELKPLGSAPLPPIVTCTVLDIQLLSGSWENRNAVGIIIASKYGDEWAGDIVVPSVIRFPGSATYEAAVLSSSNIYKQTNIEYIEDTTSQATYGIMVKRYVNKSITHPFTLYKYAQRILAQYKTPPYQYSVDVVNLAEVRDYDYSLESLGLDTRVRVIDDLLSVDVNTSIVSMSIDLLSPADITIELSTVKTDLSDIFKDIISTQNINQSVATQISAGQVTVLGTFVVADWASAGATTIDGGNITANTITASQVDFTVVDGSNIVGTINASDEGIVISADKISITAGRGNRTFRQATAPEAPVDIAEGDIWLDSDDGDREYRYSGSVWVDVQDAAIAQAISDASTAQATADGKVTTFYQDSAPTADGIGDLWIDTDDGNKLYRWSGSAWTEIQDAGIASAIADAATAQSTADGKIVSFYQDATPTAEGVGDLWFDTDDYNKCYRWSGTAWVDAKLANTGNIISTINVSTEGITISGAKIAISGDTTFSTGYDPSTKITSGGAAADINNNTTTISGGKITTNTIAANALTTSTMTARTITLSGADSILQGNYTAGSAGWQIKGDGNAEFNNVTIRGTLEACTVGTGQTLSILGDITLSGSADMRIIGSNGTISFYDNTSDYYPKILIYNVGTPTISMRNSGNVSTEEMQLTTNSLLYSYSPYYNIFLNREYCAISVGNNSSTNSGIKLKGLDGSIYCVSINASDSGDGTIRMNSTVLLNTNTIYFGDTSHFLYRSGDNLYWFDGSSSHQIN